MEQPVVGEAPHAGHGFVHGIVGLQVVTLQVPPPLPEMVDPHEVQPVVAFGLPVAAHQSAAMGAEGLVDQRRGARPAGRVERRLVQRGEDAVERVQLASGHGFTGGRSAGPMTNVSLESRSLVADVSGREPACPCRRGRSGLRRHHMQGDLPACRHTFSLTPGLGRIVRSRASARPQHWGEAKILSFARPAGRHPAGAASAAG